VPVPPPDAPEYVTVTLLKAWLPNVIVVGPENEHETAAPVQDFVSRKVPLALPVLVTLNWYDDVAPAAIESDTPSGVTAGLACALAAAAVTHNVMTVEAESSTARSPVSALPLHRRFVMSGLRLAVEVGKNGNMMWSSLRSFDVVCMQWISSGLATPYDRCLT
jgi:hypothetical protein